MAPDGATAYVTNITKRFVTPIDTSTGSPGTPTPVGREPRGIAITPDGTTAHVTTRPGFVVSIDAGANSEVSRLEVTGGWCGIAITPDGTTAYVTTLANRVIPLSGAT